MKPKNLAFGVVALSCVVLTILSCSKDLSYNTNSTTLDLSEDYQYSFSNNEMATLGRVLFYDNALSVNNSVSCGSCHKQAFAFADNRAGSRGFENFETSRNTPPIQNLGFPSLTTMGAVNGGFGQALFWDGRERILQNMVMQPIFNHIEMGVRNTNGLVKRVEERSYYPDLFMKAFGEEDITFDKISFALMSFVQNIQSMGSRFDHSFRNAVDNRNFLSPREQRGLDLFFGKYDCGSCHQLTSPTGYFAFDKLNSELVNIGLDAVYNDKGFGAVSGNTADNGKFKIPNLRNIALTAPYMHDGRFKTLEEVLDHYSTGIENNPNLDSRLKDAAGKPVVLNITSSDKQDLIAFLQTLTDNELVTDPRFSDPFKKN